MLLRKNDLRTFHPEWKLTFNMMKSFKTSAKNRLGIRNSTDDEEATA